MLVVFLVHIVFSVCLRYPLDEVVRRVFGAFSFCLYLCSAFVVFLLGCLPLLASLDRYVPEWLGHQVAMLVMLLTISSTSSKVDLEMAA